MIFNRSTPHLTIDIFTWANTERLLSASHTNTKISQKNPTNFPNRIEFSIKCHLFYLRVHHLSAFGQRRALLEQIMPFWFTDCRIFFYPAKVFFIVPTVCCSLQWKRVTWCLNLKIHCKTWVTFVPNVRVNVYSHDVTDSLHGCLVYLHGAHTNTHATNKRMTNAWANVWVCERMFVAWANVCCRIQFKFTVNSFHSEVNISKYR